MTNYKNGGIDMTKYAYIPRIEGIVFSDPCYDESVWCQYRQDFTASSWPLKLESHSEDGLLFFDLSLGRPTVLGESNISLEGDTYRVAFPARYELDTVELGMDTACIFCGSLKNWDLFSEEAAIHTGSDGLFGNLFVFTCKGEQDPAGYILTGAVDSDFVNEEDLFATFLSSFEGHEISGKTYENILNRKNLQYQMLLSQENSHAKAAEQKQGPEKESDFER